MSFIGVAPRDHAIFLIELATREIPMPDSDLLAELARFIERITAIARTGLAFKPDGFDSERYEELLKEAARMHAAVAGASDEDAEALRRRWRSEVVAGYYGYVTAAVGVGIIVFNNRNELLMIQRPTGKWWYPTGFCDVGISPAENVAKEALEETGLIVKPERLIAVIDSHKTGSPGRHIYSMLFYCVIVGGELKPNPLEAIAAGFFSLDRLPEPLHWPDRRWVEVAREFHFDGRVAPYFDPL
jgi:ADP-ribose pyrophosphatase YjhB (NUDIX family)